MATCTDTFLLSGGSMADSMRCHLERWSICCNSREKRTCTLQREQWAMEDVRRPFHRKRVHRKRRHVLVRACAHCCGGVPRVSRGNSLEVASGFQLLTKPQQIRVYSREVALDSNHIMHIQKLPAPIVLIAPSGEDSILVYTYENILYHYVINVTDAAVKLVQVGQIALHGIIRAPPRVRALSWILPEDQIREFKSFVRL